MTPPAPHPTLCFPYTARSQSIWKLDALKTHKQGSIGEPIMLDFLFILTGAGILAALAAYALALNRL